MKVVSEVPPKGSHKNKYVKRGHQAKYVLLITVGNTRSRLCYTSLVPARSAKSAFMKSFYHSCVPHSCVLVDIESQQDKDFLVCMNEGILF
jgi:hypothetical protein